MSKNAATEGKLGELHAKVTKIMGTALDQIAVAQEVYDIAAKAVIDNPDSVADVVLPSRPEPPSSLLTAITKFLSDNSITAAPEEGEGTNELADKLNSMRSRRRARGNVIPLPGHDFDD